MSYTTCVKLFYALVDSGYTPEEATVEVNRQITVYNTMHPRP